MKQAIVISYVVFFHQCQIVIICTVNHHAKQSLKLFILINKACEFISVCPLDFCLLECGENRCVVLIKSSLVSNCFQDVVFCKEYDDAAIYYTAKKLCSVISHTNATAITVIKSILYSPKNTVRRGVSTVLENNQSPVERQDAVYL